MNVLLIHGQGRTTNAMRLLGVRLHRQGYQVRYFRYYTRREKFFQIVERLVAAIQALPQDQPYALIGHSMGGLLARASLPALAEHAPMHLIMLASPSRPPRIAPLAQNKKRNKPFKHGKQRVQKLQLGNRTHGKVREMNL